MKIVKGKILKNFCAVRKSINLYKRDEKNTSLLFVNVYTEYLYCKNIGLYKSITFTFKSIVLKQHEQKVR